MRGGPHRSGERAACGDRTHPSRARLFAAVDLPADVRASLAAWGRSAVGAAGGTLRAVSEANLHLTLAFLGAREEEQAEAIGALVTACAAPAGPLSLGDALWLPPRRPGVLTVAVNEEEGGALGGLQRAVVEALVAGAAFEPETRPFRPHVTVARVRARQRLRHREVALPAPPQVTFRPPSLTLYRSRTGPGGARYEPLARASLEDRPCARRSDG